MNYLVEFGSLLVCLWLLWKHLGIRRQSSDSEPRLSRASWLIAGWIVLSASFMRQLMELFKSVLSKALFIQATYLLVFVPTFAFLVYIFKKRLPWHHLAGVIAILWFGTSLAMGVRYPQEKLHLVEYALLGWFACRDLGRESRFVGVYLAFLFCVFVGGLDEVFQGVLPYRVFELRDVLLNILGGAIGVLLYALVNRAKGSHSPPRVAGSANPKNGLER